MKDRAGFKSSAIHDAIIRGVQLRPNERYSPMSRYVGILAALLAVAPASSQTVLAPNQQLLVGKYHFEEEGIAVDVSLNADSTAVYSVGGSVGIRAEGTWDVRGDRIHIFNKPGPVKLELAGRPRVTRASPCESLRSCRTVRPLKAWP